MKSEHNIESLVGAAKKDPRFKKMKGGDSGSYAEEEGEAEGETPKTCPKCGHIEGHE